MTPILNLYVCVCFVAVGFVCAGLFRWLTTSTRRRSCRRQRLPPLLPLLLLLLLLPFLRRLRRPQQLQQLLLQYSRRLPQLQLLPAWVWQRRLPPEPKQLQKD